MPISAEMRPLYPSDWEAISNRIRFDRAKGLCERCGKPHGQIVLALPDGSWLGSDIAQGWHNERGEPIPVPPLLDLQHGYWLRVVLTTAHLNHDPTDNADENLRAWCQRCHLIWDLDHHRASRTLTFRAGRALGDLLDGPYPTERCRRAG